ncbi:MAG: ATP-binding protein [bacterium]|nr:ATP-binding protein [bacterium]
MDSIVYEKLRFFPLSRTEDEKAQHVEEGDKAVELAHEQEIKRVKESLDHYHSVLVVCDKTLTTHILSILEKTADFKVKEVTCNKKRGGNRTTDNSAGQAQASVTGQLTDQLAQVLTQEFTSEENSIVVIRHLDLMTWTAAGPRHELNDVIYWMTELPDVVKLAFWDPTHPIPKIIEDLFPTTVSFNLFSRECMWQLIGAEEAKKISPGMNTFTLSAQLKLYQYLSGTNVVEIRRILRGLEHFPHCNPNDPLSVKDAFEHIRQSVSPGKMQPLLEGGELAGYKKLKDKLERDVCFPIELRNKSTSGKDLKQADILIPKGIILYGPPGTGKTEWVKWLAGKLGFMLSIINGPELKSKYVGETEAAIRRIFSQARRTAPSLIMIDELDSLTPSREQSQSNYDSSMVAQFLTEMDGLHKEEAVLVVGTTNRLDSVDDAFKRPGRFEIQVEVDYPGEDDRKAILAHYNRKFELGLTNDSIDSLVQLTEGALDHDMEEAKRQYHDAYIDFQMEKEYLEKAGPILKNELEDRFGLRQVTRFSGDHLRAVSRYILRESLFEKKHNTERDVNEPGFLEAAVDAVRKKVLVDKGSAEPPASTGETQHLYFNRQRF